MAPFLHNCHNSKEFHQPQSVIRGYSHLILLGFVTKTLET